MVDCRDDDAVSGLEEMQAVIQLQFDASVQNQHTVDRVRLVHRKLNARLELDDNPSQDSGT